MPRNNYGVVKCPNGCGKFFKLDYRGKPNGLIQHLEQCGSVVIGRLAGLKEFIGVMKGV